MKNKIGNASNRYQGDYKKVLCVCSGGLLRSPTAAVILAGEPYNYNTRSCGIASEYALNDISNILIMWSDEIVVMERHHEIVLRSRMSNLGALGSRPVICLNIPDDYPYRDPELIRLIRERYDQKEPR